VWLVHPAGFIARHLPWVSAYLAGLNLARAGGQHRGPVYRLALCLTLGVFYASLARSADIWLADLLRHQHGADLTFRLGGTSDEGFAAFGEDTDEPAEVPLLPSAVYQAVPGVQSATRLTDFDATILAVRDRSTRYRLVAIDRADFSAVAYFRRDYAAAPLGELMNRLGAVQNGILLPSSTAASLMLREGDALRLSVNLYKDTWVQLDARLVGVFEHFPTMYPEAPVLVANLSYLELTTSGLLPHSVWLRLAPGATSAAVLDGIRQLHVTPRDILDLNQVLLTESSRLERTGTFGMLTVCFVAGAILSVADLLLHSAFMLRERTVTHAVLRALGVWRGTTLASVVLEESASVVYSLGSGIACGVLGAMLYIPYYPLGSSSGHLIPPFQPFIDWQRTDWMTAGVAVALFLAELVVLRQVARARAHEVLRLGANL
jgi:putative ABC transport system permease protein